jgi:hypothetical protein
VNLVMCQFTAHLLQGTYNISSNSSFLKVR